MNRFFSARFLVAATLATAALGAATVAEARPNVILSVGFESGPGYYQPAPVYVQPRSFYVEPAPVYVRPPVFVSPREVFERPGWGGYESRFEREREWRRAEWRRHQWQQEHGYGYRDGDGRSYHHGR